MALKTKNDHQTPASDVPRYFSATIKPPAATAAFRASGKNAWWPCMTPSATNVTPFNSCSTAPMMAGARAASRTEATGENTFKSGSAANCSAASPNPAARPQPSMRSATPLPRVRASAPGALSAAGTSTAATDDSAKSTTPPSCQTCMAMVCAAAAPPVGSSAWVARVTERNAVFSARDRASTPAPPTMSGANDDRGGGLSSFADSSSVPRRTRRNRYVIAERSSAHAVARAAPPTPILAPKMSNGSSTKFKPWEASDTRSGVTTSKRPRNAAKPTNAMMAGTMPPARTVRYVTAWRHVAAAASFGNARESAVRGARPRHTDAVAPITAEIHKASRTRFLTSSSSPAACAAATSGVTTAGTNETTKNTDEKTWFAAPSAASAAGSPSLPTQSVSTVPTSGRMRKLRIAGPAMRPMVPSSSSPRGRKPRRAFVSPPTTSRDSSDAARRRVRVGVFRTARCCGRPNASDSHMWWSAIALRVSHASFIVDDEGLREASTPAA
mmetsp:Transcript_4686/g.14675  ORF Transcript_4686/g.14675 Transcript_4686/m.14675 type:complete len:499 (+) Transcript_4686:155-1651(+)